MTISAVEIGAPTAQDVAITDDTLRVELRDGRTISAPLAWFPRLAYATRRERNNWRLIARGRSRPAGGYNMLEVAERRSDRRPIATA